MKEDEKHEQTRSHNGEQLASTAQAIHVDEENEQSGLLYIRRQNEADCSFVLIQKKWKKIQSFSTWE